MSDKIYDLVIIGAGPAGFSASTYASRYKLSNIVIGQLVGGLATSAHKICNFPSESEISGIDLMAKMQETAKFAGSELLMGEVSDIEKIDDVFLVKVSNQQIKSKTILIATGTERRLLGLSNEKNFIGKGLSYCATCDAMFFKDKVVAVIGGSDSASTSSLYLADIAKKVYQVYRKDALRGETAWIEKVLENPKIEVIYNTNVVGLVGEKKIEKIILDKKHNDSDELVVDGVFVEIGSSPQTELIKKINIKIDDDGYIIVEPDQKTNIDGVWAAGDITNGSNKFRQIVTACSEGSIAAENIFKYLKKKS